MTYIVSGGSLNFTHSLPTYPEKFVRDNVVSPFLQLSVVIVILPVNNWVYWAILFKNVL